MDKLIGDPSGTGSSFVYPQRRGNPGNAAPPQDNSILAPAGAAGRRRNIIRVSQRTVMRWGNRFWKKCSAREFYFAFFMLFEFSFWALVS